MVNSILNAVTKQLGTNFGDTYHYYVEDIEQKFTKPCFTVDMLLPVQRSRSPVLYDRVMPLVLHYFTDNEATTKQELYDKAEQLFDCLEHLNFEGDLLRGEDISWRITEGVLQFFITYRFIAKRVTAENDLFEVLEETSITTNRKE